MSGIQCSIKNCENSTNRNKEMRFFDFPKESPRCRLWIRASGRTELLNESMKNLKKKHIVCEIHFKKSDIVDGSLIPTAIPTLNLFLDEDESQPPVRRQAILLPTPGPPRIPIRSSTPPLPRSQPIPKPKAIPSTPRPGTRGRPIPIGRHRPSTAEPVRGAGPAAAADPPQGPSLRSSRKRPMPPRTYRKNTLANK